MSDLATMHPRELIRGLMRGNRAELKLGYSPANAVLAAVNPRGSDGAIRDDVQFGELELYAQGYSDGMRRHDIMASQGDTPCAETDAYCVGYVHGLLEPVERTYPSKQAV